MATRPDSKFTPIPNSSSNNTLRVGRTDRGEPLYHGRGNSNHTGHEQTLNESNDSLELKPKPNFGEKTDRKR